MATLIEQKRILHLPRIHIGQKEIAALSEKFWLGLSLILFMVLGPFAAPIALGALFTIDPAERGSEEPELLDDLA